MTNNYDTNSRGQAIDPMNIALEAAEAAWAKLEQPSEVAPALVAEPVLVTPPVQVAPEVPRNPSPHNPTTEAYSGSRLPVQAPPRVPAVPRANTSPKPERSSGRIVAGLAVVALAATVFGGVQLMEHSGPDNHTSTAHKHPGGVHHPGKKQHNSVKVVHPKADSAPSVSASPSIQPHKLTPYVLTGPGTAPTESPSATPTQEPTQTTTHNSVHSSGNGSTLRIATYNQKNRLSTAQHIAGIDMFVKRHVDIIGTQETGPHKYHDYRHTLAKHNYGIFPNTHFGGYNQLCSRNDAIGYNNERFKPIMHEFVSYPEYPESAVKHCGPGESAKAGHANMPVVFFKDRHTGQVFIVMNTHNIANVKEARGHNPDRRRYQAAKIYVRTVANLQQKYPDLPIFFTGDFNEGTGVRTSRNATYQAKGKNLSSHMFLNNNRLDDASCMDKACKYNSIGGVDFIYTSPEVNIKRYNEIPAGRSHSDHPFKWTKVTIPKSFGANG